MLTSCVSFRRVPSSEKVTSQRKKFEPIAAQLPRSAVVLSAVVLLWKQNYKMVAHHRYRARPHLMFILYHSKNETRFNHMIVAIVGTLTIIIRNNIKRR